MTDPPPSEPGNQAPPSRSRPDSAEPTAPTPEEHRAAALRAGAPGIPAKFVFWVLGVALVLSLGGLLAEHLFSAAGLNPTTTPVRSPTTTVPLRSPSPPAADRSLDAPLTAFMGLSQLQRRSAPPFTLTDQAGQPSSVPAQPASVLVLTFFNAPCNDICPVLAAEIEQADADLGASAAHVEFLTVNTDPSALAQSAEAPALNGTGLGALPNWRILTGPLATLNTVWRSYGVSITVDEKSGLEAHNDVMDFIDAQGDLRYRATPFADESTTGTYSLPTASIARWAAGIATYAGRLISGE